MRQLFQILKENSASKSPRSNASCKATLSQDLIDYGVNECAG